MKWFCVFIFPFFLSCTTSYRGTQTDQFNDFPRPVRMLDTPTDFSGWQGNVLPIDIFTEIRIGLFSPNDVDDPIGGPVFQAAGMAIEELNAAGGLSGVPFTLIQRWDDDPWRGGSKEMTRLVYRDSVWAVIGSMDGAATHIAEQVITKAWLPLLSPVSADPTLTYINIPWIFRLPPDDQKQAEVIIRDGIKAMSLRNVGMITATDHDGRIFAVELLTAMKAEHVPPVFHFQVSPSDLDYDELIKRMDLFSPDGLILRLPRANTLEMLDRLHEAGVDTKLLLPWIPGIRQQDLALHDRGTIFYVHPFSEAVNDHYDAFARSFRERYQKPPTPSAAYTYDAVFLIARALQKSGLSRSALRDVVAENNDFVGVTGRISWDNGGGNRTHPVLLPVSAIQ